MRLQLLQTWTFAILLASQKAVFSPLVARIFDCHTLQMFDSVVDLMRAGVLLLPDELLFQRFHFDPLSLIY